MTGDEMDAIWATIESDRERDPDTLKFRNNPHECPDQPHRGPQGPNEDLAQCIKCLRISWSKRPAGETFGLHSADCSLPADHESYCVGGGIGHEPAPIVRG